MTTGQDRADDPRVLRGLLAIGYPRALVARWAKLRQLEMLERVRGVTSEHCFTCGTTHAIRARCRQSGGKQR